ncbi:metallophosphoesterase [Jeotgalibaca sp. A122]|uniref:metallophosphoesterase n=1 Tax=Jeotgalibaca sp. A122 TaxID=3457322 RepID=UPI003FD57306
MRKKIGIVLLILIGYIFWGTNALEINHLTIRDDEIPDSFDSFKIAQVSDLHNKDFGSDLIDKIAEENPDMIAVTGDLIDSTFPDLDIAISVIESLCEIAPVYYVTGNHEASRFDLFTKLAKQMEAAGVNMMDNHQIKIEKDDESIRILGLEDPNFINSALSFEDKYERMHQELKKLVTDEGYQILLSHRPEEMSSYVEEEIDLVLSGHAHGGQIRLPILGALFAPGQGFFPEYSLGTYTEKNTTMVVNRGLGNSGIPFRFMNRPEVIIISLESK